MREPEVTCEKVGSCGIVALNRPKALNALTLTMVREIAAALDRWENDAGVNCVIIRGMGDKAFCAGGDIRILYDLGTVSYTHLDVYKRQVLPRFEIAALWLVPSRCHAAIAKPSPNRIYL